MNKEEAIRKMEIEPIGYECPIKVDLFAKSIIEQRENAIMEKVTEVMDVEVNKDELARALIYDRNQYYEGYRNGFLARFKRELDVKESEDV